MGTPPRMYGAVLSLCALSVACSSQPTQPAKPARLPEAVAPKGNPAAKYVEVVGFRVRERAAGKLEVTFGVVNHSAADLGDIAMNVELRTTAAKPGDPSLCSFNAKAPAVGPFELKEVTVSVPTQLRAYELPDWQFLKADFQMTEPK